MTGKISSVCVNQYVKLYFLYTVELGYNVMKEAVSL